MSASPLRVAVIDDSALYRQMLLNVLGRLPGVEVVGMATNGVEGVELVARTRPDVVTLDVQMPQMDGIEVLREFRRRGLAPRTIMVSSLTADGAPTTVAALMEGAIDYVLKPTRNFAHENREHLLAELTAKFAVVRAAVGPAVAAAKGPAHDVRPLPDRRYEALAIGCSTGGPQALRTLVPHLPADLPVPAFIVQHIPAEFSASLASRLAAVSSLEVVEAVDGMPVLPGRVHLAAGGRHLEVVRQSGGVRCRISAGPPRKGCRPSFDTLLESLTAAYDGPVVAAVLTGMGCDGLDGCRRVRDRGGAIVAEAAESCVVYGMPKAVIDAGFADRVAPLGGIAALLGGFFRPPQASDPPATRGRH